MAQISKIVPISTKTSLQANSILFKKIYLWFFILIKKGLFMDVVSACMSGYHCVCSDHEGQERALESLEWELVMVGIPHVGVGN